ncbi:tRNA threonylcarbamoyl adenosine modification protein (Sua5/YciO/YrdC/YwlC family) [Motilibacter peucedani]|uniref:L-threonylcarbamoyladenylate synthase n=1 Tax=Motilibacter peucedani TaxID=598650 RepID=A0A420XM34_9ACTN|nr:L-threonylcarbamoyladenylate synthase [Motilibacter peucedani]RKS71368.1 tRNA threonylcarbamoyl adenosine modification protein (Sua5/YciO/YrdC/YwlC family) [Motilibacter peucedani]
MSRTFDLDDPVDRAQGIEAAARAVRAGDLVVLPTDTVYGLGADAFDADAIGRLLVAKGRGRDMPVPVLVSGPRALDGIAFGLTHTARDLVQAFWPGALTLVCTAQPSLTWDLGRTNGTVAVRMPLHPAALELLAETGPMGVSSANKTGHAPAPTIADAVDQLGGLVSVYLDGGPSGGSVPSTIIDVTGAVPNVVRLGALSLDQLREVVPEIVVPETTAAER